MIHFFGNLNSKVFAVQTAEELSADTNTKLNWLFGNQPNINTASIDVFFIGPRAAMITPWSTNAVEITQNMGITGILRIEEFTTSTENFTDFDPMISQKFESLHQEIFTIDSAPEQVLEIDNIAAYNTKEGLALNDDEVAYLDNLATKLGRKLTDS
ncbi:MAG: phosphoribosylformylglycinamidine synthase, partial [Flavobacteriaceae bacterium]|nr:phosphoribosylformylglycinamidine synthase [Flavobacteriaceae bacterium]